MAGTVAMSAPAFGAPVTPGVTFTTLTLLNGWGTYPGSAAPAVASIAGIVTFKGALSTTSTNTNLVAFVLPAGLRPAKYINIPVDMCNASEGELNIAPTGVAEVISDGATTSATCFTSLDGASFTLSTASFTKLKVKSGWQNGADSGRVASAGLGGGYVHLAGELRLTGKSLIAFTLPAKFRPVKSVYVPVNMCTGEIGRLDIFPSGEVKAQPQGKGNIWEPKCGLSLEGASYALATKSFTALKLKNGWKNGPYGTAKASVRMVSGLVRFRGAVWTGGTSIEPFILPKGFRPGTELFVTVDMCGGSSGRLIIQPSGVVEVESEISLSEATCFTSLDGASFAH